MDRSRAEVYNHPKPWFESPKLFTGFQYEMLLPFYRPIEGLKPTPSEQILINGQPPKQERFYGVGCRTWWHQWNEPNG